MSAQLKMNASPFLCITPAHAGLPIDHPASQVAEDYRSAIEATAQKALDKLTEVQRDGRLSPQGKAEATETAAKLALKLIAEHSTTQKATLERQRMAAQAQLPAFPSILALAKAREGVQDASNALASESAVLRKQLAVNGAADRLAVDLRFLTREIQALSQPERDGLLEEMSGRTDDLAINVLLAFRSANTLKPLASPDRIKSACDAWLKTNHPEPFQALEIVDQCQTLIDGNSKAVAKAIEKAGGLPQMSGMSSDVKITG